jgi:toxin ParE1/3/4
VAAYRLNAAAADDIERLYRFGIDTFGLEQADRYLDGLFERFDRIAEQPLLYQAVDHIRPGYRRSSFGGHAIYYRMMGDNPEIMRVLGREKAAFPP